MAKKLNIYFKINGTLQRLDNFKYSYSVIIQSWNKIVKNYNKKNFDGDKKLTLTARPVKMTVKNPTFIKMSEELKIKGKVIKIYYESSNRCVLELTAE